MKRYRLVDGWGEPYYSGYNETDLKKLAFDIFSLWDSDGMRDDESFYWKTDEEAVEKIYSLLKSWERDLVYRVEESGSPFPPEGGYGRDDEGHNYEEDVILKYAKTRDDLKYYDEELMVEFVWHGWHGDKPLSEILDEFSMVNYKEELFDDLNNMLFNTYDEVVEAVQKWMAEEKGLDWDRADCTELASEFVDRKELYDISYD